MDAADCRGVTPLLLAVSQGHRRCVQMLMEAGENCRLADARGRTAGQLAVRRGDAPTLRLLVWDEEDEVDEDAASTSSDSNTSSSDSSSSNSPSGGGGDGGSGWDASRCRSFFGDFGNDCYLLAFAEERDAAGSTLLHQAAAQGQLAAVAALANKRTNWTRDGAGLLPLQAAAKAGQRGAAMLLLACQREQHSWSDWKAAQEEEKVYWQQVEEQERQREQQAAAGAAPHAPASAAPVQQAVSLARRRLRFNFNHLNYKTWTVEQRKLQVGAMCHY